MRTTVRGGIQIAVLAVTYLVTAKLGLMMDAVAGFATLVWPPTGISLAALLVFGYRLWPGIAIGAFLANLSTGAPVLVALGIASGNSLEAVFGVYALRRIPGFQNSLERLRDVMGFLVFAAVVSTTISATVGVVSLSLAGILPLARFDETWRVWWLGDVIGNLIVAPLLLVWSTSGAIFRELSPKRIGEAGALALSAAGIGWLVFGDPVVLGAYLFFLPLIWAALRFGQRGVVTTMFAISVATVGGTVWGYGPFVRVALSESLIALQAFMAVAAATFLILASSLSDGRRFFLQERQARATAEGAVRSRDAFLSVASHELRNPLSALVLNVELLERSSARGDHERTAQTAGKLRGQVQRLTQLVENLLDVSRIKAGGLHLDFADVDLSASVRDVIARFEPDIRRAECTVDLVADVPVVGLWDPMRIEQITTNLLSNALKYGSGKPIELRVEGDEKTGRLIVRDCGVGIAEEDQPRIFEQFARVGTGHVAGLGLGLWIVREIVFAFGGSIRVVSALGQGTTFTVELPRKNGKIDPETKAAP